MIQDCFLIYFIISVIIIVYFILFIIFSFYLHLPSIPYILISSFHPFYTFSSLFLLLLPPPLPLSSLLHPPLPHTPIPLLPIPNLPLPLPHTPLGQVKTAAVTQEFPGRSHSIVPPLAGDRWSSHRRFPIFMGSTLAFSVRYDLRGMLG